MFKHAEIGSPNSCLNKAKFNEMLFVLLERDAAAPTAIRAWIAKRIELGKNTPDDIQILEALQCAEYMDVYRGR